MPIIENKKQTAYPEELIQIAKEKGYKAANLEFLDKLLLDFNAGEQYNINIEVPKHISISNRVIIDHLNQYSPNWQKQWHEFCELQGSNRNLKSEALAKLKEIHESIHLAFAGANALKIEDVGKSDNWMVRSTGEEDRVDVANPGGNESYPSDSDSINSSIGLVIASYFSEKSMSQRLKSDENITAKPPLMACLIQKLIGETQEEGLPPVSGVIYTDAARNVRIQAAYGHGELVVNSKGNFDNIFVTKENVVHQYLGDKKIRLVPIFDSKNKRITLEEVSNTEFAKGSSLSEEISMNLAKFANFVEAKYGMRMDLEFVFDPNNNMINIVQARPIPEGKRKGLSASALSDAFIATHKPPHSEGQIITPDVMTAKVITSRDEVLICNTIDEALTSFLKNENNKIKAVIINKTAPDTSHEAGFFSSQAIPVIYSNQYDLVTNWADNLNDNVLIVDSQHSAIYKLEQTQFQDNLIEEGVFRSTLAPFVTPIKREFSQGPSREHPSIQAASIGELIIEARTNPDATQKLFRFIHDEIKVKTTKSYDQTTIDEDIKQLLNYPVAAKDFQSHGETLGHLLNFVSSVKNEKTIAASTYEQLMINGMELYKALKEIESNPQDPQTKMHYLNIHQKFKGLMTSEGAKGIISTSFSQEVNTHNEQELLKQQVLDAGFDLSKVPETTFLNLARHKVYLFNDKDQQKWLSFCYTACQNEENANILKTLVDDIVKLGLKDYWMNINFLTAYDTNQGNALTTLNAEYTKNLAASENILEASKLIDQLEHQIGQWSKPEKFAKLFENEFKQNVVEINRLLTIDSENTLAANLAVKQLYRLTDVIDLSIKQLQNSHLYENKEQQVENFKALLGEFFTLMHTNVNENIGRIQQIKSFLNKKSSSNQSNELLPSRGFSVMKADFFQDSYEGFERGFTNVQGKTLADLHTLTHQTLLGSVARKSALINPGLIKTLPESVIKINNNILNSQASDFANYQSFSENSPIELLYINADYPQITLNYKVPLRSHAGTMNLSYDIKDQNIKLDFTLFGFEGNKRRGLGRWEELEEYGFLLFKILKDTKLIEHKGDDNLVYFQLEIKHDSPNLKELFGILKILGDSTMDYNSQLSELFSYNGEYTQILRDQGLSPLILASYRDGNKGKLNFKALHEDIKELKNPTEFTQKNQEIAACLRLMAMDDIGAINYNKLKALEIEFSNSELNVASLIIQNFDKFPNKVHAILIDELIYKDQTDKVLELAEKVTDQGDLANIATALINKDQTDKALELAKRITDQKGLENIAIALINKDQIDKALELAKKITDQSRLANIVVALINQGQIDKAHDLAKKITNQWSLVSIATALINKNHTDKAIELADEKITEQGCLASIARALIDNDQTDKALELAEKIADQDSLAYIAIMLINKDQTDKAFKLAERITDKSTQMFILGKFVSKINDSKDLKYGQVIEAVYDLAIKQNNEEVIKKLLPRTSKSNIANSFKDPLRFPTAEAISPPSSNSGYVVQDYEKPTIVKSNQQFIAQHDSQRTIMSDNPTLLMDPSYNVGFTDNLHLLRVVTHVAQNIFSTVKDSWINTFGENADLNQVKETITTSEKQFKALQKSLMIAYQEIMECYKPKVEMHNNKSNQLLGNEIYQLKQFKEQAEQITKDLLEAQREVKKFKADLKDSTAIKQAYVEKLEQKVAKIEQEHRKFFEAITASRDTSNALNKPTASELAILEDTSTKIVRVFGGESKDTLPILLNVKQLPLHLKEEVLKLDSVTGQLMNHVSKKDETRSIK